MLRKVLILFALLATFVLAKIQSAAAGEVFQWIDSKGVIHFTDDYLRIPDAVRSTPNVIVRHRFVEAAQQPPSAIAPSIEPAVTTSELDDDRRALRAENDPVGKYLPDASADAGPSENVTIVVVNNSVIKKPCHGHGCSGRFQPNFNDRRYIHPDVFNGGTRQYIHPNAFSARSRQQLQPAPRFRRK